MKTKIKTMFVFPVLLIICYCFVLLITIKSCTDKLDNLEKPFFEEVGGVISDIKKDFNKGYKDSL